MIIRCRRRVSWGSSVFGVILELGSEGGGLSTSTTLNVTRIAILLMISLLSTRATNAITNANDDKPNRISLSTTRRIPLLVFLWFMGVVVLVAGLLAHDWSSWNGFWHQEAVLDRLVLRKFALLSWLDAVTTQLNWWFERVGWLVALVIIGSVQGGYVWLLKEKRRQQPKQSKITKLSPFSGTPLKQILMVEGVVLVMATVYFLLLTHGFKYLSRRVGSCTRLNSFAFPVGREKCRYPAVFRGFDISGHCFLIVHSCLLVLEYLVKAWYIWGIDSSFCDDCRLEEKNSDLEDQMLVGADKGPVVKTDENRWVWMLIALSVIGGLLIGGEIMIYLQTILFYHTVTEKLLGTLIGSTFWMILFALSVPYPHLF